MGAPARILSVSEDARFLEDGDFHKRWVISRFQLCRYLKKIRNCSSGHTATYHERL